MLSLPRRFLWGLVPYFLWARLWVPGPQSSGPQDNFVLWQMAGRQLSLQEAGPCPPSPPWAAWADTGRACRSPGEYRRPRLHAALPGRGWSLLVRGRAAWRLEASRTGAPGVASRTGDRQRAPPRPGRSECSSSPQGLRLACCGLKTGTRLVRMGLWTPWGMGTPPVWPAPL